MTAVTRLCFYLKLNLYLLNIYYANMPYKTSILAKHGNSEQGPISITVSPPLCNSHMERPPNHGNATMLIAQQKFMRLSTITFTNFKVQMNFVLPK